MKKAIVAQAAGGFIFQPRRDATAMGEPQPRGKFQRPRKGLAADFVLVCPAVVLLLDAGPRRRSCPVARPKAGGRR